ncbi:hypothetical protein ACVIJ6_002463 [Bradyrhizobium sp. USDA 4369]
MNVRTLATASFALLASTLGASAQCVDCAMYPDRDHLNGGEITPAGKMGLQRAYGAVLISNGPSEAIAGVPDQDQRASGTNGKHASHRHHPSR